MWLEQSERGGVGGGEGRSGRALWATRRTWVLFNGHEGALGGL